MTQPAELSPQVLLFWRELRMRLLWFAATLGLIFLVLSYFANPLYTVLAHPLLHYLPNHHLISTQLVAPVFAPFKLAFVISWILSMPFLLWQIWHFVAPALYKTEKKWLWLFLLTSTVLFYLGLLFAYYFIFPPLFKFLITSAPQGVEMMPDMSIYLDFSVRMLLTFGSLFEIPLIICALTLFGIVQREQFAYFRPYALVGSFVLGMLLAPPDVLSQTLLAIPIYLLFESGLFFSRWMVTNRNIPLQPIQSETINLKKD